MSKLHVLHNEGSFNRSIFNVPLSDVAMLLPDEEVTGRSQLPVVTEVYPSLDKPTFMLAYRHKLCSHKEHSRPDFVLMNGTASSLRGVILVEIHPKP